MAEYDNTEHDTDEDSLFLRLKSWVIDDRRAAQGQYKEIDRDFDFYEGGERQWEKSDITALEAEGRPHTSFNFIQPSVSAVNGMEVSNRHEVTYKPRTTQQPAPQQPGMPMPPVPGANDQPAAELYTAAGKYFRQESDAEDEESDAFQDTAIGGMGWTETRIDFDEDPAGKMTVDRCDPTEMGWDKSANKRNLVDARRFHRVREIDKRAALEMFPGYDCEDIDAAWARPQNLSEPHDAEAAKNYENDQHSPGQGKKLTVVEISWFDIESSHRVANTMTGEVKEGVDAETLKSMRERAKQAGIRIAVNTVKKRVFRQAFLGSASILGDDQEGTPCQSQKGFKWNCMTGTRARNSRQWMGIVRAMRDPQRWANALYSSTLWTVMTSGKGIMAERDAFEKPDQAESDWSSQSKIVFLRSGALSGQNPKIMQKTPTPLPAGSDKLMEFAITAIRGVSGVNLETLGGVDREQAASLEYQRRQAATTILAPFFDGLRRYRKAQGRVALDLIDKFMSDGRLIRIAGPDYEQYVPLLKDPNVIEYDIIVDESPSSPNQKEASWATINQMLPVVGKQLGPRTMAALMKASPLPTPVVKEFQDAAAQEQQDIANAPPPPEVQLTMAQVEKTKAETALKQQEGAGKQMELAAQVETTRMDMQDRQMERGDKQAQRDHDHRMRSMEMQGTADGEFAKAAGSDMPQQMAALGQGLVALAQAVAQGQQMIAQGLAQQGQAIEQLAAAASAPRKTDLIWSNGMPVGAVSAPETVQSIQ